MSRERTLLERIAERSDRGRSRYEPTTAEDVDALMESVRRNLGRLLNARHGMSEAQPDYGLPAMTDLTVGSGNYVPRVQDAITRTIERYEPRLRRVRVAVREQEGNTQMLVFRVDAVLVGRSGEHRVWYETSVMTDGQFDVAG